MGFDADCPVELVEEEMDMKMQWRQLDITPGASLRVRKKCVLSERASTMSFYG